METSSTNIKPNEILKLNGLNSPRFVQRKKKWHTSEICYIFICTFYKLEIIKFWLRSEFYLHIHEFIKLFHWQHKTSENFPWFLSSHHPLLKPYFSYMVLYCLKHFHIHHSINLSQKSYKMSMEKTIFAFQRGKMKLRTFKWLSKEHCALSKDSCSDPEPRHSWESSIPPEGTNTVTAQTGNTKDIIHVRC